MIKRLRIWIYQYFGIGMDETEYLMNDPKLEESYKRLEDDKGAEYTMEEFDKKYNIK
jgi:hypothetical protein